MAASLMACARNKPLKINITRPSTKVTESISGLHPILWVFLTTYRGFGKPMQSIVYEAYDDGDHEVIVESPIIDERLQEA